MSERLRIAVIPGDGIGLETAAEGVRVLRHVAAAAEIEIDFDNYDWGCDSYVRTGRMMPDDALETLSTYDAIFLGAVGRPDVPDRVSVWELILPIRRRFEQYVNLRPVRLFPGVSGPLAGVRPEGIDFVVVRENTEGEYLDVGGVVHEGTDAEICSQLAVFTRRGTERIARFAFEAAQGRRRKVLSATKSNGLPHSMPYWDRVVADVAGGYADVTLGSMHIDALAAFFVLHPEELDVVVASNLFGDILSDLGAAISGSIGMGPSANLDPSRRWPSMFEPIHGSAPDIAGRGIANPVGQIWSGAMMLEHLGHREAGEAIVDAITSVFATGVERTPDLGGTATTRELADAVTVAFDRVWAERSGANVPRTPNAPR